MTWLLQGFYEYQAIAENAASRFRRQDGVHTKVEQTTDLEGVPVWAVYAAQDAKITATDGSVEYLHYVTPTERAGIALESALPLLERIAAALEKLLAGEPR